MSKRAASQMRCDCHAHIVGAAERYPQAAARTYLAQPATLDELRRRAASRSISHFVIGQPSFYGTDNSLLLESLDALGDRGRGVAVVEAATPRSTLLELAARRIRGLRLNLYSPSGAAAARQLDRALTAIESIALTMNWHVEVI